MSPMALTQQKFSISLSLSRGITGAVLPENNTLQKPFLPQQLTEAANIPLHVASSLPTLVLHHLLLMCQSPSTSLCKGS